MTPPGAARSPGLGRRPQGDPAGVPLDVLMPRMGMVITRVMYYKCKAPQRTYHYMTYVIKYI